MSEGRTDLASKKEGFLTRAELDMLSSFLMALGSMLLRRDVSG